METLKDLMAQNGYIFHFPSPFHTQFPNQIQPSKRESNESLIKQQNSLPHVGSLIHAMREF